MGFADRIRDTATGRFITESSGQELGESGRRKRMMKAHEEEAATETELFRKASPSDQRKLTKEDTRYEEMRRKH